MYRESFDLNVGTIRTAVVFAMIFEYTDRDNWTSVLFATVTTHR